MAATPLRRVGGVPEPSTGSAIGNFAMRSCHFTAAASSRFAAVTLPRRGVSRWLSSTSAVPRTQDARALGRTRLANFPARHAPAPRTGWRDRGGRYASRATAGDQQLG